MSSNQTDQPIEIQPTEPDYIPDDDTIPQITMAFDQLDEIVDKKYGFKSLSYKLKYLKAKKDYYYK